MARTRSIKPAFFHDVELTSLPPLARLLFAGLWCYADREGRLEDKPKQIKHDILPDDRCSVEDLLNMLAAPDPPFIIRYGSGSRRYIQVRAFNKHQNPHIKEPASIIPAPCESGASPVQAPCENSSSRALTLLPITGNCNGLSTAPPARANGHYQPSAELWEWFQGEYPGEVNPFLDAQLLVSAMESAEEEAMLRENLPKHIASDKWRDSKYIPKAENYLSKRLYRIAPKERVVKDDYDREG